MEQRDTLSNQISFATDGSQYLTFRLAQEDHGVEILKVVRLVQEPASARTGNDRLTRGDRA